MLKRITAVLLMMLLFATAACAEDMISASIQVKASRSVYDSVIRTGEDVDMTVQINGFTPAVCLWYRGEQLLEGENQPSLHISSADVDDTGIYRMDALDTQGRVRLSVDVALRVVDSVIPKTGDARLPAAAYLMLMGAAFAVMLPILIKKAACNR